MIFGDFAKALGQITDPRFMGVVLKGVGLTLALLLGFTVAIAWGVGLFVPDSFSIPFWGEVTWIDNALSLSVIPVMFVASIFLMVPVASAFIGFFLDQIVDAVEAKHYPEQPPVSALSWSETLEDTARFLSLMFAVNLVAVVLYVLFAPFALFIFWAVNGLLLGREYAQLVAQRRLGAGGAQDYRKRHFAGVWVAGVLMAVPLSIPFLNLFIPILGVATFTHQYHRLNRQGSPIQTS